MNMQAQWEDETNNRLVELLIDFSIENSTVVIDRVTPTKIVFPQTQGSLGVHTQTGRKMLAKQFLNSPNVEQVKDTIAANHGLLAVV